MVEHGGQLVAERFAEGGSGADEDVVAEEGGEDDGFLVGSGGWLGFGLFGVGWEERGVRKAGEGLVLFEDQILFFFFCLTVCSSWRVEALLVDNHDNDGHVPKISLAKYTPKWEFEILWGLLGSLHGCFSNEPSLLRPLF